MVEAKPARSQAKHTKRWLDKPSKEPRCMPGTVGVGEQASRSGRASRQSSKVFLPPSRRLVIAIPLLSTSSCQYETFLPPCLRIFAPRWRRWTRPSRWNLRQGHLKTGTRIVRRVLEQCLFKILVIWAYRNQRGPIRSVLKFYGAITREMQQRVLHEARALWESLSG